MLRKSLSGFAFVVLMAASASAQIPFQETFQFTSVGVSGFDGYSGKFYDVPGLTNISKTGELNNTFFQVWCVDPMEYVYYGQVSVATVTPMTSSSSSPDYFAPTFGERTQTGPDHALGDATETHVGLTGPAAMNAYQEAAYLASQMTVANETDYENAMWTVMGYAGHNTAGALAAIATINLSDPNFHADEWGVITSGQSEQEFIYHRDDGGHFLQVTPEPATMSLMAMGLVGMAGSTMRRRKQRKS